MIQRRFRRDYAGEFIILETRFVAGEKQQTREWIDNPITNQHISKRAAVVGSDVDIDRFDYSILQRHRGSLHGKKKLQTYGTGETWQRMTFDFFVTADETQLSNITESNYDEQAVVYSTAKHCIRHPGHFYLVPYTPYLDQLALAVYLAAFDGHEEIFLLGYNQVTPAPGRLWTEHVDHVIRAYNTTKFYLVGTESNMPKLWRQNRNVECMDYRRFVTYCDV